MPYFNCVENFIPTVQFGVIIKIYSSDFYVEVLQFLVACKSQ